MNHPEPELPNPGQAEIERLKGALVHAEEDRLVLSPWSHLRLTWVSFVFSAFGTVSWIFASRAMARSRGLPESLLKKVGVLLWKWPKPVLQVFVQAGAGVALFAGAASGFLILRAVLRYRPTRHASRVQGHRNLWLTGAALLSGAAFLLAP